MMKNWKSVYFHEPRKSYLQGSIHNRRKVLGGGTPSQNRAISVDF